MVFFFVFMNGVDNILNCLDSCLWLIFLGMKCGKRILGFDGLYLSFLFFDLYKEIR